MEKNNAINTKKSLRTSLLTSSALMVIVLAAILAAAGFWIYRQDMIARYQNYAGDSIDFIARCINGDDLEQCIKTGEKTEAYHELQKLANDFKETHDLIYIYIIKPLKINPPDNMMDVFAAYTSWGKADGTDGLTDLGKLTGDAYPADVASSYMKRMDRNPSVTYFRNDTDFGKIYTAIRPIFNSKGEPIAVICGDILIDDINAAVFRYVMAAVISAAGIGLLVFLFMNYWFNYRIVSPLARRTKSVASVENKCHSRVAVDQLIMDDPAIHTEDEIEALSRSIMSMALDVNEYAQDLMKKDNEILSMKEYVNKMDVLAYRDSLTGAGNKAAYEKAAKRLDWDILAENANFAMVMCDLNYLKKINDNYGHDKGNEYIKTMNNILKGVFEESPIFRIGGDEFIIILQEDEIKKINQNIAIIKDKMHEIFRDKTLEPWQRVSTAIGYAIFDQNIDKNVADVFKRADQNMYQDKQAMHAVRED